MHRPSKHGILPCASWEFGEQERLLAIPYFFQTYLVFSQRVYPRSELAAARRIAATDAGEVFANDTADAYELHGSDCVLSLYQLYDSERRRYEGNP